ncbi:hypothetical protein ACFE04_024364 [Oxalis oulophora]
MSKADNIARANRALKATQALGLKDEVVKPILRDLWELYDRKWLLIESENYRTLIDACFESTEKGGESKGKQRVVERGSSVRRKETEMDDHLKIPLIKRKAEQSVNGSAAKLKRLQGESGPSNGRKENKPNCKRELVTQRPDQSITDSALEEPISRVQPDCKKIEDISKGMEKVKISLINDYGKEGLPKFTYMPQNLVYQNAYLHVSLARISDEDCCLTCKGDCLAAPTPCACTRETQGQFAYTSQGLLREEFLEACVSMKKDPVKAEHFVYCQDCPLQKTNSDFLPGRCEGHLIRKFIKECWIKCGCSLECGNRVVQRGISQQLQVFMTQGGKGWGVRPLKSLPKGSFVCEYVGEILTNTELYERNMMSSGKERHTYPVTLDADWGSEKNLRDEEALCLDATKCGNVARFINHRCFDANLIDIPVEVETPDRHYYHLAFFTTREVRAREELTWDYGIDFDDHNHPVKAFECSCGFKYCRGRPKQGVELMDNSD